MKKYLRMSGFCPRLSLCGMLILFVMALAGGCSDDLPEMPADSTLTADEDGYINIHLKCAELSRATEEGVADYNENLIRSVTVCLWPTSGDRTEADAPVYMHTFTGLDAQNVATLRIPMTGELVGALFNENSDRECYAYAAVNVDPGEAKSVEELRRLAISSEFTERQIQPFFTMDGKSRVSYSGTKASGSIDVKRSACKISLALNIDESIEEETSGELKTWTPVTEGAFVRLISGVKESTLEPSPTPGMADEVYFDSNEKFSYLFSNSGEGEYPCLQDKPFYSYPNRWSDEPGEFRRTHMLLAVPWTSDGGATVKTCYYQVPVVPLDRTETVRNMSYHINLHVGVLGSFVPEKPVELTADYYVADWGEESADVEIKDHRYLVVDYNDYTVNNENGISIPFYTSHETVVTKATLTFYRYNYSDEGDEFPVSVTLGTAQNNNSKGYDGKSKKVFDAVFDNKANKLNVTHELKIWDPYKSNGQAISLTNGGVAALATRPRIQDNAKIATMLKNNTAYFREVNDDEYSRVKIEVTVQHKDMQGTNKFTETVTIMQYPGMYITAIKNNINRSSSAITGSGALASCIINGNYVNISGNGTTSWQTSIGLNSASYFNWNPNLYLVTITQLPPSSQYIIADPRSLYINNTLSNASIANEMVKDQTDTWSSYITAQAMTGSKRTLKYYYPTREGDLFKWRVAPKFRICSSYGGTSRILNRQESRRRAAAYQEHCFPAGRWRLPTFGEVHFVMSLASQMKIPRLFGCNTSNMSAGNGSIWYYWCAQGLVKVPPADAANTAVSLPSTYSKGVSNAFQSGQTIKDADEWRARFVYDEWYWGDDNVAKTTGSPAYPFTWGDAVKKNPEGK